MKFQVSMKDPDTLDEAIREAVGESLPADMDPEERDVLAEIRFERVRKLCARWFGYGEYLTVEIDTEALTCTVIPEDRP